MITLKRIVLDVLKPHQPDALEFCRAIAELQEGYEVILTVQEIDEETQTLQLEIRGPAIELAPIESAINSMGGSLHSIDHVEMSNEAAAG
jgi:hypothetical protein